VKKKRKGKEKATTIQLNSGGAKPKLDNYG
jgi:hypothetical protein